MAEVVSSKYADLEKVMSNLPLKTLDELEVLEGLLDKAANTENRKYLERKLNRKFYKPFDNTRKTFMDSMLTYVMSQNLKKTFSMYRASDVKPNCFKPLNICEVIVDVYVIHYANQGEAFNLVKNWLQL